MLPSHDYSLDVTQIIRQWDGISVVSHSFGGYEFLMGKVEIGHIHYGGMLDIPYTIPVRKQLVSEGKTGLHHLLADSGWTTTYIHADEEVEHAIWLLKVSWLQKRAGRVRHQPDQLALLHQEADSLEISPPLYALIFSKS